METKSLLQTNSVHNYFNAFHRLISPVVLSLTVIVSRSRIYANIGHGFSINFDVDLIDTVPQIFIVFRGDIVISQRLFSKSVFQLSSEEAALSADSSDSAGNTCSCAVLLAGAVASEELIVRLQEERTSGAARAVQITGTAFFKIKSIIDNLLG